MNKTNQALLTSLDAWHSCCNERKVLAWFTRANNIMLTKLRVGEKSTEFYIFRPNIEIRLITTNPNTEEYVLHAIVSVLPIKRERACL